MNLYRDYGIYGIKNKINHKVYVGKTEVSFGDRRDCHYASLRNGHGVNSNLQRDWCQYGESNFEFVVLYDCVREEDSNTVNELERKYIKEYMDNNLCYNVGAGGNEGAFLGKHLSEETKRKIGDKNRVNMTGRKLSGKTKAKMSASQRNRYEEWTDEDRVAYGKETSKYASGYTWSKESKKNFSEMQKIKPNGAKYDINIVHKIREMHEQYNKTYSEISNELSIPRPTVYLIATYRRWRYA